MHLAGLRSKLIEELFFSLEMNSSIEDKFFYFILFTIYFLHSRESELYRMFWTVVRTRMGVAMSEVSGSLVCYIKVGRPVQCLAQGHN